MKIWQGGFLDMSGELINRGNNGLALGYDSREIGFGEREYLLAPLNAAGSPIDFSFKEGKFGDFATFKAALNSQRRPARAHRRDGCAVPGLLARLARQAGRAGVPLSRRQERHRDIDHDFRATAKLDGARQRQARGTPQSFALNRSCCKGATASAGKIENGRWNLPAGKTGATLRGTIAVAAKAWTPAGRTGRIRARRWCKARGARPTLPAGYSIENYYPPKDNYGRDQLFEALGLALAKDGTIVVATRTAGIWRIVNGEWARLPKGCSTASASWSKTARV